MSNKIKKATEFDSYFLIDDGTDTPFKVAKAGISTGLADRIRRMYAGGIVKMFDGGVTPDKDEDDAGKLDSDLDVVDQELKDITEDDALIDETEAQAEDDAVVDAESSEGTEESALESEEDYSSTPDDYDSSLLLDADAKLVPFDKSALTTLGTLVESVPGEPTVPMLDDGASDVLTEKQAKLVSEPKLNPYADLQEVDNPNAVPATAEQLKSFGKTTSAIIQNRLLEIAQENGVDASGIKPDGAIGPKTLKLAEELGFVINKDATVVPKKYSVPKTAEAPAAAAEAKSSQEPKPAAVQPVAAATKVQLQPQVDAVKTQEAASKPSKKPPVFSDTPVGRLLRTQYDASQAAIEQSKLRLAQLRADAEITLDQRVNQFLETAPAPAGVDPGTYRTYIQTSLAGGIRSEEILRKASIAAMEDSVAQLENAQALSEIASLREAAVEDSNKKLNELIEEVKTESQAEPKAKHVFGEDFGGRLLGMFAVAAISFGTGVSGGNPGVIISSILKNFNDRMRRSDENQRAAMSLRYKQLRDMQLSREQALRTVDADAKAVIAATANAMSRRTDIDGRAAKALAAIASRYRNDAAKAYSDSVDDATTESYRNASNAIRLTALAGTQRNAAARNQLGLVQAGLTLDRVNQNRARNGQPLITMEQVSRSAGALQLFDAIQQQSVPIELGTAAGLLEALVGNQVVATPQPRLAGVVPAPVVPAAPAVSVVTAQQMAQQASTLPTAMLQRPVATGRAAKTSKASKARKTAAAKAETPAAAQPPAAAPAPAAAQPPVAAQAPAAVRTSAPAQGTMYDKLQRSLADPDQNMSLRNTPVSVDQQVFSGRADQLPAVLAKTAPAATIEKAPSPDKPYFTDKKPEQVTGVPRFMVRPARFKEDPYAALYAGYAITPEEWSQLRTTKGPKPTVYAIRVKDPETGVDHPAVRLAAKRVIGKTKGLDEALQERRNLRDNLARLRDYVPTVGENGKIIPAKKKRDVTAEIVLNRQSPVTQQEAFFASVIKSVDLLGAYDVGVQNLVAKMVSLPQKVFASDLNDIETFNEFYNNVMTKANTAIKTSVVPAANQYQNPIDFSRLR